MNTFKPDYALHPGEYLAEVLASREIKKSDFAKRAGISAKAVSQIINGKSLYSIELALAFERVLDIDARLWMNLANNWLLFQTKRKEEVKLANEATQTWLKRFPVADLRKMGIVSGTRKPQEIAEAILRFFNVSSSDSCSRWIAQRAVSFRKSTAFSESPEATALWLQIAEREAVALDLPAYQRDKFKGTFEAIRSLTLLPTVEAIPRVKTVCAEVGLSLVIIPKFEGTRLSGASWWFGNDRPVIALSLRYRSNDHFWFTFFHESAHILLHGKKGIFLDSKDNFVAPDELEADAFARDSLIAAKEWKRFVDGKSFHEAAIKAFAKLLGIHPAIVVGRLQHENLIEKNWHNSLKESIELPAGAPHVDSTPNTRPLF